MKRIFFIVLALCSLAPLQAQDRFMTRNGHIRFYSHTPMEDIDANNNQVGSILDMKTGEIVVSALNKSFEFSRALMQEHFNENYMESDKYPKSAFKGTISNVQDVNIKKDGTYPVDVKGDLTIHGVTKPVVAKGTLEVKAGKINAVSKFNVAPEDYNITIPSLVREKIAKNMEITVELGYEPFTK